MTAPPTPPATPLFDLLKSIDGGRFLSEANASLVNLLDAMAQYRDAMGGTAKGKIGISIVFAEDGKYLEAVPTCTIVSPKPKGSRTVLYRTKDGSLSPERADQIGMDFTPRVPEAPAAPIIPEEAPRPVLVVNDK